MWIRVQQHMRAACTSVCGSVHTALPVPHGGASVVPFVGDLRRGNRVSCRRRAAHRRGNGSAAKSTTSAVCTATTTITPSFAFAAAPFASAICTWFVLRRAAGRHCDCRGLNAAGVRVRQKQTASSTARYGECLPSRHWRNHRGRCVPSVAHQRALRSATPTDETAVDVQLDFDSLRTPSDPGARTKHTTDTQRVCMNVGALAPLLDDEIDTIVESAIAKFSEDDKVTRRDLDFVARHAVAATGGHLAVSDAFFFECQREIARLSPKKVSRWKTHCSDAGGTRRNVVMGVDGMLKVRDDVGRLAPLVPASISTTVNGDSDFSTWMEQNMPRFLYERVLGAAMSEAAPLPEVRVGLRRAVEKRGGSV